MQNSDYLRLFLDEAEEAIDRLGGNFVLLEKNPEDMELINEVFRDAHTIKGSSGAMGFAQMAAVTHVLETVLSLLRSRDLVPSAELFSAFFAALDLMRQIKQDVYQSGQESTYDTSAVVSALEAFVGKGSQTQGKSRGKTTAKLADGTALKVEVFLRPNCPLKAARAFVLISSLKDLGEVTHTEPDMEEISEERFGDSFAIWINTDRHPDELVAAVTTDSDVEDAVVSLPDVTPVAQEQIAATATATATVTTAARQETKQQSVRVDVRKLESLMNLVGELVIERNRLATLVRQLERQSHDGELAQSFAGVSAQLGRITGDLQLDIMKARMIPISQLFSTVPRLVRDLSSVLGKELELEMLGTDTEIDRTIAEEIRDPLIHVVRNAIDHGIETPAQRKAHGKSPVGKLILSAFHQENNVIITISDDGKGIDAEAVAQKALAMGLVSPQQVQEMTLSQKQNMVFLPGLSTAAKVTDVSGRGVGMDVVSSQLEKLGGSIEVQSEQNVGTTLTIRLPLTLAIIRGLLVQSGDRTFCLPIASVAETLKLKAEERRFLQGMECVVIREQIIPLRKLYAVLGLEAPAEEPVHLLVAASGAQKVGFLVDKFVGEQEVVIKPLGPFFTANRELAGATILGDGRVVPILDVKGLVDLSE